MNYELTETFENYIYNAELKFDCDITNYIKDDNFNITISDLYADNEIFITKDNILDYGLVITENKEEQINESLVHNKGILIYFPYYNTMNIKLLPLCKKDDDTIGIASSRIFITFNDSETVINPQIFPKITRSLDVIKQDSSEKDPILSELDLRPGYDFDELIDNNNKSITANYVYNSLDCLYVNTTARKQYDTDMVPMYLSTVSAYTFKDDEKYTFDWDNAKSYLYNSITEKQIDIEYKITNETTVELPIINNYVTELNVYEITQYIYTNTSGKFSNDLIYYLPVKEYKIE